MEGVYSSFRQERLLKNVGVLHMRNAGILQLRNAGVLQLRIAGQSINQSINGKFCSLL